MKKTIILCLSILMIALTGCKKDQNTWGKLNEGAVTIKVGETKQLTFTSDGNVKPQWTSEDETVVTVDANGVVTGVRVGSAYVSVNGLQCKVTVIDDYMNVVEPIQDWYAEYEDVTAYMVKNFGNSAMVDVEMDTALVIREITYDTIYVLEADPAEIDTIIADTLFDSIAYVSAVQFTYDAGLEGQFVDTYMYGFEFDEEAGTSYLRIATMTVNAAHVGEIEKFLNNRYVETSKGNYKAINEWYYYSYIMNDNPVIIYSASKIEDK